jgi:pimeloyl-ACP methyl ester carboxylesterase
VLWLESELARDLIRAWLEECESVTHAAAGAVSELLADVPLPGGRPTLHWERTGSGPPVLLIMGLGLSGGAWWRTAPVLARELEVITFDNRGVGRSLALFHAYSTAAMADDAVSVLDAADVERAHVYGISLGGMIAQQLALRHPDRVQSLVLGATHAGGSHAQRPDPEVLDFLRRRLHMGHEEAAWTSVPFNYGRRCRAEHAERIEEDVAERLKNRFSAQAYRAQMWAASTHDTYGRLHRIRAPALVVPRARGQNDPGRERADPRRANPARAAHRAAGLGPPVSNRGARNRAGDQRLHARAFLSRWELAQLPGKLKSSQ